MSHTALFGISKYNKTTIKAMLHIFLPDNSLPR
jgi:hypothetical protein